jgi:ABC-type multidrug transport system fused ATPase/permease subunit
MASRREFRGKPLDHEDYLKDIQNFGNVFTGMMQSVGASRKVFKYIDRQPAFKAGGALKQLVGGGELRFDNVRFAYPTRSTIMALDVSARFSSRIHAFTCLSRESRLR